MQDITVCQTEKEWSPIGGYDNVLAGYKQCWARALAKRYRGILRNPLEQGINLRLAPRRLDEPIRHLRSMKQPAVVA